MYTSSYTMTSFSKSIFIFLFAVIYVAIIIDDTLWGNDIKGNRHVVSFGQAIRMNKQVSSKKDKNGGKEQKRKNVDDYSLPLKIDLKKLSQDNEDILRNIQKSLEQLLNGNEAPEKSHNDINEYEENEGDEKKETDEENEKNAKLQLKKTSKKKKHHKKKKQVSHGKKGKNTKKNGRKAHVDKEDANSMLQLNSSKSLKNAKGSVGKSGKSGISGKSEKSEKSGISGKSEKSGKSGISGKSEKSGKNGISGKGETDGTMQSSFKVNATNEKKKNRKSETVTENKLSSSKKKGEKSSSDIKDDVSTFVDVLDGLNKFTQEENDDDKKKNEVDDKEEQSEGDDDHSINKTEVIFDGADPDKDLYQKYKKKGKKRNIKTFVAMGSDYLGAGYDILFGNPLGDSVIKVDPGYRDSIIKLTYPKSDEDYPDNYKNMSANGSYIRYEIFCSRQEQFSSIHSIDEYFEEVKSDFSLEVDVPQAFAFSASHDFKNTSTTLSDNKHTVLMLKSYCNHYVASLSNFGQWKLSDQFQRAISLMPPYFNSQKHDKKVCEAAKMRNKFDPNSCGESVILWLKFFKNFGTHIATLLHIGGKIVQKTTISDKSLNKYKLKARETGVDAAVNVESVKIGLGFSHGSKNDDNSKFSQLDVMKEIIMVGGDTVFDPNKPKSFEHWSSSVKKFPMPIKGTYVSIGNILPSHLVHAYNKAFQFYVDLYAPVKNKKKTPSEIEPSKINIRKLLKSSDVEVVAKSGLGFTTVTCPTGKSVILGFAYSISTHREELYHIDMQDCAIGKSNCSSNSNDLAVYNYVFALCATKNIPYLKQITAIEKQKYTAARCPSPDDAMLWGLGIVYNAAETYDVSVVPCTMEDGICHINSPHESSYIATWNVCGHENYEDLMFALSLSKTVSHPGDINRKIENGVTCPKSSLFTINIQFFKQIFETQNGPCIHAWRGCPLKENDIDKCSIGTEPDTKSKKKNEPNIFRDYSIYHLYVY